MSAEIFRLDRGFAVWVWLCETHLKLREHSGWMVKEKRKAPHELTCDDCEIEKRAPIDKIIIDYDERRGASRAERQRPRRAPKENA